jgi:hypothetical protein
VKKDSWFINIMDHGGHGDGVTSDDAAFVSALAAINPTWGGKVFLPAGHYLINGNTAISLSNFGTVLEGVSNEASKIVIDPTFTGVAAVTITGNDCKVENLSIAGANSSTTTNAVCNGVYINGAQRAKISKCTMWFINGWATSIVAGNASGTNPSGTMITGLIARTCAGGIKIFGTTASGSASVIMSDIQIVATGVTTGTNANLDAIRSEDAWDVFGDNIIAWMTAGTGNALHLKGHTIYNTFTNVEFEGTSAAPAVLIEDGPNGSPYATKIALGVCQLGTIGVRVTGAATIVNLLDISFVNNATHGLSIEGTGNPINVRNPYFIANGSGAAGTNYDVNWSGSSIGFLLDARHETAITAVGVAGVQKSINVPSVQNVRIWNASFAGVGAASSNWVTNVPNGMMETSSGAWHFMTRVTLDGGAISIGNWASQPSASSNVVFSSNVAGTAAFDSFRLTGDGTINAGAGTTARDTTWGRLGAALFGSSDSDIVANLAGKGLKVKEGTNAKMGLATLNSGTGVVINTTVVTANSRIFLTIQAVAGTTPGTPVVVSRVAGTSFTIKSTGAADTSTVAWMIVEPA